MEKKFFYILKFQNHDNFKIGVSDVIYSRILKHHNTYSIDFEKSFLVKSKSNKVTALFETEMLAYFSEYRDFSFKPKDGFSEIFDEACLDRIVSEIQNRSDRFPNLGIEITSGIDLPEKFVDRMVIWEQLLLEMKAYGYYPSGISSLHGSLTQLHDTIKKQLSEEGTLNLNKINTAFTEEFIEICDSRIEKGLIYPFYYEWSTLDKFIKLLDEIEKSVRLDKIGLEKLYVYCLGTLLILSEKNDNGEFDNHIYKLKSLKSSEFNMMKRTGEASDRFLSWKGIMDQFSTKENLREEHYSFGLYEDSEEIVMK